MAALLSAVGALGSIAGLLTAALGWLQRWADEDAGAQKEALAVTTSTAKTETAIAQAEVDSPRAQAAIVTELDQGKF